jgi:hypothetical protein
MSGKIFKFSIIVLLFCSFFIYSYNAFFNGHYHRISNGLLVFHSHPFDKSGTSQTSSSHAHSKLGFLNYELLASLLFSLIVALCILTFYKAAFFILQRFLIPVFTPIYLLSTDYHRGPPLFV